MACSKYEYVKQYELPDNLLPGTFIIFRLDGHSFHRFSEQHEFKKPNDIRALQLMDRAASDLMNEYPDLTLAFGESDEFSFLMRKSTNLYNRRNTKIATTLTSYFTSSYVYHWSSYFPHKPLKYPPSFDGRLVMYPSERHIRDYFSWRQVDTHINNLYNTVFWALVLQAGQSTKEAHATLQGTASKQKHEILFSRFKINYNSVEERYKKGSVLVREPVVPPPDQEGKGEEGKGEEDQIKGEEVKESIGEESSQTQKKGRKKDRKKNKKKDAEVPMTITLMHCDIIKDEFWIARPYLLDE